MKALKYILFFVLIFIIGFSIYVAVQPNSFEVTRTKTINAPQAVVYNNIIDFKNWESWNSWVEEKPEIKIMLSEQTKGVGGSYSWEDENRVGTMKTIAVNPYSSISQEMQFADFPANAVTWNLKDNRDGTTEVTWSISGKDLPLEFKMFSALMGGMEKQIGPHYERGLVMLDSILKEDMKRFSIDINGITEYGGGFYMYKTTSANGANISQIMGKQYGEILSYMNKNDIKQIGMPFTIYNEMNAENGNIIMSQAIPIQNKVSVAEGSEVLCAYIPKIKVLKTTLKGNYFNLPKAWKTAMAYLSNNNIKPSSTKPFEIYQNDPDNYPNPADWLTEIYIPIKE